jgi:hypothetical protein
MTLAFLRRLWPLAVVAALLILAAVAAAHTSLRFNRIDAPISEPGLPDPVPTRPTFPPQPREVAGADQTHLPGWVLPAIGAIALLVIVVLVALLLRLVLRDLLRRRTARVAWSGGRQRHPAEGTAAEVVAALDAGLIDLSDADADPRRAVIACWVRLEQAAAAAGIPGQVGDTPTDLVTRLLRGSPDSAVEAGGGPVIVSADVLAAFAHVYREARYATHTVDERMRTQARSALTRLRAELTAEVPS